MNISEAHYFLLEAQNRECESSRTLYALPWWQWKTYPVIVDIIWKYLRLLSPCMEDNYSEKYLTPIRLLIEAATWGLICYYSKTGLPWLTYPFNIMLIIHHLILFPLLDYKLLERSNLVLHWFCTASLNNCLLNECTDF